jgi:hypothetical protein
MNNNLPPQAVLMHLVAGKFVTQALAAAAELNLAEYLVDGPRTAGQGSQQTPSPRPTNSRASPKSLTSAGATVSSPRRS